MHGTAAAFNFYKIQAPLVVYLPGLKTLHTVPPPGSRNH